MSTLNAMIWAAVAGFMMPPASEAASVVLGYSGVQYSQSSTFATGVTTVPSTPGVTVILLPSAGYYVRFNVTASVAGDVNPGATSGYADVAQPATLGVAAFGASVTNTNSAFIAPVGAAGGFSSAAVNGLFASSSSKGIIAADGSVGTGALANLIAGGTLSSAVDASDAASIGRLTIGNAGSPLFSRLTFFVPFGASVNSVLTAVFPTTSFAFVTNVAPGADGVAPAYGNRNFNAATDTLTGPGSITFLPEPASLAVLGVAGAGLTSRCRQH